MDLKEIHVLVVEDDDDCRTIFRFFLEAEGAEVTEAASVAEAVAAFTRRPPNVVVSDISMPDGDGYALMRTVRALPATMGGKVPAVAVTAFTSEHHRQRALSAGFDDHLTKPVEPDALCGVVSRLARRQCPHARVSASG